VSRVTDRSSKGYCNKCVTEGNFDLLTFFQIPPMKTFLLVYPKEDTVSVLWEMMQSLISFIYSLSLLEVPFKRKTF
jgi:hypothetical protein